jgi:hypothetical protein
MSAGYDEEQLDQTYSRFSSNKYFSPSLHLRELAEKVFSRLIEIETDINQSFKMTWKESLDGIF